MPGSGALGITCSIVLTISLRTTKFSTIRITPRGSRHMSNINAVSSFGEKDPMPEEMTNKINRLKLYIP